MDEKILSFVVALIAIGISTIVSCQACANALAVGGTSSSMYSQKRNTIVSIYISATISATIFLYAFICNIKLIYDLKKDMNLKGSFYKLGASIVYASTAYSVGEGIGKIVKEGMPLVENAFSGKKQILLLCIFYDVDSFRNFFVIFYGHYFHGQY